MFYLWLLCATTAEIHGSTEPVCGLLIASRCCIAYCIPQWHKYNPMAFQLPPISLYRNLYLPAYTHHVKTREKQTLNILLLRIILLQIRWPSIVLTMQWHYSYARSTQYTLILPDPSEYFQLKGKQVRKIRKFKIELLITEFLHKNKKWKWGCN